MSLHREEANEWLFYASEDLAYGKIGMRDYPRAAAWSFQQSAEKVLKGLWILFQGRSPKTHDIAFLFSELNRNLKAPLVVAESILVLAEITPAIRYPADDLPPIEREDAENYQQAADVVYDWAVNLPEITKEA